MTRADENLALFKSSANMPEGFVYREDFLPAHEEQELIGKIQNLELTPFQYYQFTGRRRTLSFGWEYEFGKKGIRPAAEIPDFLLPLRERAGNLFGIEAGALVHASVIEYPPGASIGWHRDIPHFGLVAGISLSAPCRMRLRKHQTARNRRGEIVSIELQPRSAYLMSGPAREQWQHSIAPVAERRYAIMLRTLRAGEMVEV